LKVGPLVEEEIIEYFLFQVKAAKNELKNGKDLGKHTGTVLCLKS